MQIRNRIKTTEGKCTNLQRSLKMSVEKSQQDTVVVFSGTYPKGCGEKTAAENRDEEHDYVYGVFKALWNAVAARSADKVSTV